MEEEEAEQLRSATRSVVKCLEKDAGEGKRMNGRKRERDGSDGRQNIRRYQTHFL
jgi:hypothetical protein